jgi:hypothetical protein
LTEKKDFANEGMSMAHCIGGQEQGGGLRTGDSRYWQAARDDETIVLSLRNPEGVPQATVEMKATGRVMQVQGPKDREPGPEAMRRLREAFWAIGVYPGQKGVPRLGHGGVYSNAELLEFMNALRLRFDSAWWGLDRAYRDPEDLKQALWTPFLSVAKTVSYRNGGYIGSNEPVNLTFTFPADRVVLGGVYLENPNTIVIGLLDESKPPSSEKRVCFLVGPANLHEQRVPSLGLVPALRALTGVPKAPPDVSFLEVLPGLPRGFHPDTRGRIHVPVAEARRQRAMQGMALQPLG